MASHSEAFATLRDLILDVLDDEDRRRLAAILGSMTEPQPEPSPALVQALGGFASLDVADRTRLSKWCGQYLNRWGQVPQAASRRASRAAESR